MPTLKRKVDAKGRLTVFADFANADVVVERVNDNELRIKKTSKPKKYKLADLLAGVTDENKHPEIGTSAGTTN